MLSSIRAPYFYNVMAHLPFYSTMSFLWLCLLVNLSYVFLWLCFHEIYISSFGLIIFTISTNLNPFCFFFNQWKTLISNEGELFLLFVLLPVSHCKTITALISTQLLHFCVCFDATCSSVLPYFPWVYLYVLSLVFVLLHCVLSKGQLLFVSQLLS